MRIKRIEIIGFKSFVDKTVLRIDEPITGIVGPNGCGKSNVVDAIRWCMGEQSAKHLRGKAMEDVIFQGSDTRAPGSMSEVSLTFENVGFHTQSADALVVEQDPDIDGVLVDGEMGADVPPPEALPDGTPDPASADLAAGQRAAAEAQAILADAGPIIDFSQYGEVTVTRRLFRDGTSGYFINKTPCRLRDITDFFLGTGVGTKAYSIIEQGRVGAIVSAKPQERRAFIEEAAGITKFKKKKAAAERKMEQTRQNLLRVSDIVGEIEKQLGSLRRQAQKAERYKTYKAEMRDIDLWSASHRWLGFEAQDKLVRTELELAVRARDDLSARFDAREAGIVAERAETALEERRLTELTEQVYDLENRIKLTESHIDFQGREAQHLEERAVSGRGEIEALERQIEEADRECARAEAESARLEAERQALVTEAEALEETRLVARGTVEDAEGDLVAARGDLARAQADIARAENQQRSLVRRDEDLAQRLDRLRVEERELAPRHIELKKQVADLDRQLGRLRQTRFDLGEKQEAFVARLEELKRLHEQAEAEVETLRTERHRRRSRLQSLEEIQERYEGFARGTRAVMKYRPGDDEEHQRIRGLVADVVETPVEYEAAVEAVLGERLGSVLVESRSVGLEAISFLKERAEGRSTFIPVQGGFRPSGSTGGAGAPAGIEVVEASEGVRGALVDMVRVRPEYEHVAGYLFRSVLVVESLEQALRLWESGLRATLVTLDGDVIDEYGVVTGGSREVAGAGVLAQKREIRELSEICAALDADLADASARQVSYRAELTRVGAALDEIRRERHEGDIQILAQEKDLARFQADAARVAERKTRVDADIAELDNSLAEVGVEGAETTAHLADARARAADAERMQEELIEGVTIHRRALDEAAQAATECRVRVAQVGTAATAMRNQLVRLGTQTAELATRLDRTRATIEEAGTRSAALRAEAQGRAGEVETLREERRLRALELAEGRAAHERRMTALQAAELEVRAVRIEAERVAKEASRLELAVHDIESQRRHLDEAMDERYRIILRHHVHEFHLRAPVGDTEEARLKELRELLHRMGEINLTAIEEYEALAGRYEFLTKQKQDLEDALEQLERAIQKINRTSRKLFRETYDAVNAKFQEVFPRLFRGGKAELRLTHPEKGMDGAPGGDDHLLDAGVEIFAQPPGKKNVTVELLSGGEKALTAVSLIFAIFLIKPSPFCILDEVDAPLDDANVDRYNELVRQMTDNSQFIVITHNKRTMEIADQLYGVTMEEPGCSKLVGVNLRLYQAA